MSRNTKHTDVSINVFIEKQNLISITTNLKNTLQTLKKHGVF